MDALSKHFLQCEISSRSSLAKATSSQHEKRCLGSAVTEITSFFPKAPSEFILRPDRKPSFPWVRQACSGHARSQQHGDPGAGAGCCPFEMLGHLSPLSASLALGQCPPTMDDKELTRALELPHGIFNSDRS